MIEVEMDFVLPSKSSFLVKTRISKWLIKVIKQENFGYEYGETTVLFGFKKETDRMKFEEFLSELVLEEGEGLEPS